MLPVRIGACDLKGLLGPLVPMDLVGLNEEEARQQLLAGVKRERAKPAHSPFPHASTHSSQEFSHLKENLQKSTQIQPITVLFMASNPQNASKLALDEEMRAIVQKVLTSEHRDALVFQCAWAARPDDLLQCLNQHRPQIIHFSGHGRSEGLSFIGDDGQEKLVPTRALQAVFSTLKDNIQLVVLNTCYSRAQAEALVGTIDCVIGMKERIHDDAAIAFSSSLYRAVGFGRSLQEAFEQGMTSLLLEGLAGNALPELLVKDDVNASHIHLVVPQDSRHADTR